MNIQCPNCTPPMLISYGGKLELCENCKNKQSEINALKERIRKLEEKVEALTASAIIQQRMGLR